MVRCEWIEFGNLLCRGQCRFQFVVNWEVQPVGDQVPQKAFGRSRSDGVAEGELF